MLNNFKVLLGLLIVISGFAYYVTLSSNEHVELPKHLMPTWQNDHEAMTQIDRVLLSKGEENIELSKQADGWLVNGGFYANLAPLSELMQSLKQAEVVEAKTKNPENFGQLELTDNDLKITLFKNQQVFDEIHIGKRTSSGQVFVRRAEENQTYLVKGLTPPTFNQNNWQLSTIIDVPESEVVSVTFEPADDVPFSIERNDNNDTFELANLAEDHQLKANTQLNSLATGLSRLMIDEALPLDLSQMDLLSTINYRLSDDSKVKLKLYQQDQQYFLTIAGEKVNRYQPWMMKIANYKFEALNQKLENLIEPTSESNVETVEQVSQ